MGNYFKDSWRIRKFNHCRTHVIWEVLIHAWGNLCNNEASGSKEATDNSSCHHLPRETLLLSDVSYKKLLIVNEVLVAEAHTQCATSVLTST